MQFRVTFRKRPNIWVEFVIHNSASRLDARRLAEAEMAPLRGYTLAGVE